MQLDHQENIIELSDVCFSYQSEQVLKDVNLKVHKGDYLGVVGPNGGGKTTLLKLMVGLLKPSCGTIKLFGQDINDFKDWSKIGYVFQKFDNFDINFPITVEEVVAMGRFAKKGLFRSLNTEDKHIVKQSLEQVEMASFSKRLIGDLSGGQMQRVFIARSLASQPQVIILDEPTAGVDVKAQEQFYRLLENLNENLDITLILVSHDVDVIASVATELALVNKTLVYKGSPKEFLQKDNLNRIYGKGVKFILHDH